MKTRLDFISNSSSCSFIIAISNEQSFKLNDLIDAIANGCMKHYCKDESSKSFAMKQNEFNRCILNYHWRASECLYLGDLVAGYSRSCYDKNDPYFNNLSKDIKIGKLDDAIVISHTSNEIVIDWPKRISSPAVPKHKMDYIVRHYVFDEIDYLKSDDCVHAVDEIMEYAKDLNGDDRLSGTSYESDTYFISKKTIWNTRALIDTGKDITLPKWADLDKFEKMLENGERILAIRINQGGDGVSDDSVYSYGGWDGLDVFNDIPQAEVIATLD